VSVLLAKTIRSSTFRLAVLCIVIFGAVVVGLFGYVYRSTASYVHGRADRTISTERTILERTFAKTGRGGLEGAITRRIAEKRFARVYLLADNSMVPLTGNINVWPSTLKGIAGWGEFTAPEWKPEVGHRPLLRASYETLSDGSHLLVGEDIDDLSDFMRKIDTAVALAILLVFVLAGVASLSVTRRTVGRIEAINATSRLIMQSGLDRRIPLRGTKDEWDELAENLNSMLDRIETLMEEVRRFTDNIAHDLRTPLTRMRGRLEKAYAMRGDDRCDQALIGNIIVDLDAVLGMFTSLMRISQIEASDQRVAFRRVDLSMIAREVIELFDAAAEDRGGHVELLGNENVAITGDRDLLFDAVSNLVDNAIKHGRERGHVTVMVTKMGDCAVISVADDGPGIPADECDRVFKRFYRLERSRGSPGNGLGLSLVAAVAGLHGARIETINKAPGVEFRLTFPKQTTVDDVVHLAWRQNETNRVADGVSADVDFGTQAPRERPIGRA